VTRGVALISVLGIVLAGCGGDDSKPLLAQGKAAAVRGALTPDVHLFGEPVVATVEVIVDREQIEPGAVRVKTDFKPYETVGQTVVEEEEIGQFTQLRYSTTLRCLREDCIPRTLTGDVTVSQTPELPLFPENQMRDEKRKYEFPPAIVTVEDEPADRTLGRVVWRPLRSVSRINWYDSSVVGQGFPFVSTVTPVPEPSYRISPTALGVALIALAVALLALPAIYLVRRYRARRAPQRARGPAQSPLERALGLVEWASRRPSVDERREALEALAYELDAEEDETASRARAQGWSPPSPATEEMTGLVAEIREGHAPSA
jgi:hypothetical protein